MPRRTKAKPTQGKPAWLPPLGDARAVEILGAAYDVFLDKGFAQATMLDVARRARASKETLYARFGSKKKLFESLMAWGA